MKSKVKVLRRGKIEVKLGNRPLRIKKYVFFKFSKTVGVISIYIYIEYKTKIARQ